MKLPIERQVVSLARLAVVAQLALFIALLPNQSLQAKTPTSISVIAWSPDGILLAIGKSDGTLQTVDTLTRTHFKNFYGHTGEILSIAWSPDGSKLASTGEDQSVRVWNASTGTLLATYTEFSDAGIAVKWSPDGKKLASLTFEIRLTIHDVTTNTLTYDINSGTSNDIAWSPDATKIAIAGQSVVGFFDMTNGDFLPNLETFTTVYSVAWSPDGSKIAAGELDGTIEIWNVASRQLVTTIKSHTKLVSQLMFTLDGTKLTSVSQDGSARVWSTTNWFLLHIITFNPASAAAWSPDGSRLAIAGPNNTIRVVAK